MEKTILVDMDGVLADVYSQFQKYEKQVSGSFIAEEKLIGKYELDVFPNGKEHVLEKGFFRTVPVMEGSSKALEYLNVKYNLLIVSSATEFPNSLTEKMEWLNENFMFLSWKQVVLCGRKDIIKGDIMIDDHLKNLDYFNGEKIIFSQPHNLLANTAEYKRLNNWEEVYTIL